MPRDIETLDARQKIEAVQSKQEDFTFRADNFPGLGLAKGMYNFWKGAGMTAKAVGQAAPEVAQAGVDWITNTDNLKWLGEMTYAGGEAAAEYLATASPEQMRDDLTQFMTAGAAGLAGAPGDVMALATGLIYNIHNQGAYGQDYKWVWPENFKNIPATMDYFLTEVAGFSEEDLFSLATITGAMALDPGQALAKLAKAKPELYQKLFKGIKALGNGDIEVAIGRRADAEKLHAAGASEAEIYQKTGFFPKVREDGSVDFAFLISDEQANLNKVGMRRALKRRTEQTFHTPGATRGQDTWRTVSGGNKIKNAKIGDTLELTMRWDELLDHPQLFAVYPEIAGYQSRVTLVKTGDGLFDWELPRSLDPGVVSAGFHPEEKWFAMKNFDPFNEHDPLSAAIHEMQHAVQAINNWSSGGNLRIAKRGVQRLRLYDLHKDIMENPELYADFDWDSIKPVIERVYGRNANNEVRSLKKIQSRHASWKRMQENPSPFDDVESYGEMIKADIDELLANIDKEEINTIRWMQYAVNMGDDKLAYLRGLTPVDVEYLAYRDYLGNIGEIEARLKEATMSSGQRVLELHTPRQMLELFEDEPLLAYEVFGDSMSHPFKLDDPIPGKVPETKTLEQWRAEQEAVYDNIKDSVPPGDYITPQSQLSPEERRAATAAATVAEEVPPATHEFVDIVDHAASRPKRRRKTIKEDIRKRIDERYGPLPDKADADPRALKEKSDEMWEAVEDIQMELELGEADPARQKALEATRDALKEELQKYTKLEAEFIVDAIEAELEGGARMVLREVGDKPVDELARPRFEKQMREAVKEMGENLEQMDILYRDSLDAASGARESISTVKARDDYIEYLLQAHDEVDIAHQKYLQVEERIGKLAPDFLSPEQAEIHAGIIEQLDETREWLEEALYRYGVKDEVIEGITPFVRASDQ